MEEGVSNDCRVYAIIQDFRERIVSYNHRILERQCFPGLEGVMEL
jgi:hypothetical protein